MQSYTGYYSLIQYCPDMGRLEALNVGIALLCPELSFLKTRWARNAKQRLQKVFGPAQFDLLQSEVESFDSRLTIVQPPATQEEFQHLANTRAGSLRLTPPRYLKVFDPQEDIDKLFVRLVPETPPRQPKLRVAKRLMDDLRKHKLFQAVNNPITVELPELGKTIHAKLSYQNGRVNLIHPQQFPANRDDLLATTGRLALEGNALYSREKYRMVVVAAFGPDAAEAARIVTPQLAAHQVSLHDCNDLRALHQSIEQSAREHNLL